MNKFKILLLCSIFCISNYSSSGIGYPWNNPLNMAWSADGTNFNTISVFQDSSGVPTVVRWGDTLVAAFQWFRQPNPSPSWDRVAVKFSYDNGIHWASPAPIVVNGMPGTYQRPFDPTLTVFNNDSIRIFFSSSAGMMSGGLDSNVNTYSAISADGINYIFESGARVDEINNRVIDPALTFFNTSWHYIAPIGSPQQGAYHYISSDGINFSALAPITSDVNHNYTGNLMSESTTEMRYYGCGQNIWFNSTADGNSWNGFVNTNITGGDPAVIKIAANNYLMIYVGHPYPTVTRETEELNSEVVVYPDPSSESISLKYFPDGTHSYVIYNTEGKILRKEMLSGGQIPVADLASGIYFLQLRSEKGIEKIVRFVKE